MFSVFVGPQNGWNHVYCRREAETFREFCDDIFVFHGRVSDVNKIEHVMAHECVERVAAMFEVMSERGPIAIEHHTNGEFEALLFFLLKYLGNSFESIFGFNLNARVSGLG